MLKVDKLISIIWLILFICTIGVLVLGGKSCTPDNSKLLDTLSAKAHAEQQIMRDTIVKYDTIKLKADVVYRTKTITLWKLAPSEVDDVFNVVYPRDSLDTTNYSSGYTQLRKAVDTYNKSVRDSIKEQAAVEQVKTCTTTVTKIVNQIDTVKEISKEPSKTDWKTLGVVTLISIILGFVGGFAAN